MNDLNVNFDYLVFVDEKCFATFHCMEDAMYYCDYVSDDNYYHTRNIYIFSKISEKKIYQIFGV